MNIFVLEDRDERMPKLRRWLDKKIDGKYTLTHCKEVVTAMDALLRDRFDVLFLDHDLDQKAFVPSQHDNTGYQLAKFIEQKNIPYSQCFIHSMNPQGAHNMSRRLPRAKLIPFNILMES